MNPTFEHIVYFDFECSTDGEKHKPYLVCWSIDNVTGYCYDKRCALRFLETLPNKSLCYAHNLTYDISFLLDHFNFIYDNPIIKSGRVLSLTASFNKKRLTFKDSYSIISKPLRDFPLMFKLETGRKEVFPYQYYDSTRSGQLFGRISEALKFIPDCDKELFVQNCEEFAKGNKPDEFNMKNYAVYYCNQDVNILKQGFEWFRNSLLSEFNLDAYYFVSISSIANKLMNERCYKPNGNLFDLANTPREFISRCVHGGRCMLCDNTKNKDVGLPISDFDAVSLYPSAIHRLYCLEGIPKVLTEKMLSQSFLVNHLFNEDQYEPTRDKFISGFFIEAKILSVGVKRHFPLIVWDERFNGCPEHEYTTNDPCVMYMDHIQFIDLIKFQKCIIKPIRGYYYDGKRDTRVRTEIENLFNLRLRYKKQGNPLQEVIKILLNSVYGKTILKPIDTKVKFINASDRKEYIQKRYNNIKEIVGIDNVDKKAIITEYKAFNRHFSFVTFGVNILSMSKRIMNEVVCLAEDLGMNIHYTDTDSFMTEAANLIPLANAFKAKYNRELIGKQLGQFHPDLEEFGEANEGNNEINEVMNELNVSSIGTKGLWCMKKGYIIQLTNRSNEVAFHIRMKGIPSDVIVNRANELFPGVIQCEYRNGLVFPIPSVERTDDSSYSIMKLYEYIYDGGEVEFDLCKGSKPRFDIKGFEITTKTSFNRLIKI